MSVEALSWRYIISLCTVVCYNIYCLFSKAEFLFISAHVYSHCVWQRIGVLMENTYAMSQKTCICTHANLIYQKLQHLGFPAKCLVRLQVGGQEHMVCLFSINKSNKVVCCAYVSMYIMYMLVWFQVELDFEAYVISGTRKEFCYASLQQNID